MAVMNTVPKTLAQLHQDKPATAADAQAWITENGSWLRNLLDKHKHWMEEAQVETFQAAYDGFLQSIDERDRSRGDDVNNKLQVNYAQLIIDTVVDYMLGKPIVWAFDPGDEKVPEALLEAYRKELLALLRGGNAQRVLAEQLRQGSIAYYSGIIAWVDENGEIDYEEFPVQEIVPVYDTRGRLQLVIRYYQVETIAAGSDQAVTRTKVELYDSRYITYFLSDETGQGYTLDQEEAITGNPIEHKAGRIPVSIYVNGTPARYSKRNQRAGTSDLGNGVLTLLENYAAVMSDKSNTVDRLLDQYLLLAGVDVDENEVIKMRKARAIALKSKESNAQFIAPTQDDQAVENHLDRLRETIHEMTFTPKLADLTGATATEIKIKYANLDIKAGKKELYFAASIKQLVEILTDLLNAKRLAEANVENVYAVLTGAAQPPGSVPLYNADWVLWTINRNMPQNFSEIAQIVAQLAGIVPDEYLYELLWFIDDPQQALDDMKQQKEEALKANMDALGFGGEFGQTGNEGGQGSNNGDAGGGNTGGQA
ncbi:phage portal protein [Brevibacillus fulvus]|uniref:SPP1 family phage portal protein n=1 Tax=Brevibacillus fulvus TaxID=1125967 RepID=A0A938Y2F7_9BACL|nr:phage portal protein [Brevibacillus fulvus]MBM7591164.1 SPP1 family phage portal protein [Brevibacillus fulvus]